MYKMKERVPRSFFILMETSVRALQAIVNTDNEPHTAET